MGEYRKPFWPYACLTGLSVLAPYAQLLADEPLLFPDRSFVDTRFLTRQAGQDLPPSIGITDLSSAAALQLGSQRPADRAAPLKAFGADKEVTFTAGYDGAGDIRTVAGVVHEQADKSALWAGVRRDNASPYLDGGGSRVGFGYDRLLTEAAVRHDITPDTRIHVFALRDAYADFTLPHYGIDAPRLEKWVASSVVQHSAPTGPFDKVEGGGDVTVISYGADNITLRPPGALGLAYKAQWVVGKGLLRGEFHSGPFTNTVTADGSVARYNTDVFTQYPTQGLSSYRIPEAEILRSALTFSSAAPLSAGDKVVAGLRVEGAHSRAAAADHVPAATGSGAAAYNLSPQQLWDRYYGAGRHNDPTDLTVNARLLYTHRVDAGTTVFAGLRREVRIPEAGERFYANSGSSSLLVVGDPELAPEAHHKAEIGGEARSAGFTGFLTPQATAGTWKVTAVAAYDRVHDFITADHARGQAGVLMSDQAIVYRNVEAWLGTTTLEGWWQALDSVGVRAQMNWAMGDNLSDHRPLYQVPPLEGAVTVEHRREVAPGADAGLGLRMAFAGTQHRVDAYTQTGSGQDTAGQTPGYSVWDLFGSLTLRDRLSMTAGVANLFDKRYATHVVPLPQGPTTRPLEAPGRSLYLMVSTGF